MIKGKKNISIFKRTIPKETYEKACAVLIFMIVISYLSLFIVMCNLNEKTLVIDASFDIISSIATVGLSAGAINNMNIVGIINIMLSCGWNKEGVIIMLLMYLGRVGTITTAVAFMIERPRENDDIVYAKEDVIVG